MEKKIYRKFRTELLKHSFEIQNKGMCVIRKVAEDTLREAIEYCMMVNKQPYTDWWDEDVRKYDKE